MEKTVKLYQYAVVFYPTKEEAKDGKTPEVAMQPDTLLAKDINVAALKIARMIPPTYENKLDQLEIILRPF